MTTDTTTLSYWLNWRFFLCATWVLTSMVASAFIVWKFEGFKKPKAERRDDWQDTSGSLFRDEAWRTSLKVIHPAWLLAYRLTAFTMLLALLIANVVLNGGVMFYYYTQWTFTLVTIYFGLASSFSIYGCCQRYHEVGGEWIDHVALDAERGTYVAPTFADNAISPNMSKSLNSHDEPLVHQIAGLWGYVLQIIFQICAGAVVLTDCVFWFILYPLLSSTDSSLSFIEISMHSLNAVFLLGDVTLNCLRFPFFRIAYFNAWTGVFVIFQWIIHACISMEWPYPFMDLSSAYAPIWYLGVGLLQLPCFGIFALVIRMKQFCLSRLFPDACQDTLGDRQLGFGLLNHRRVEHYTVADSSLLQ